MKGSKYLEAGSRNPYLPEKIPLNYDTLLKAMQEAVDKIAENGGEVVNEVINPYQDQEEKENFDELMRNIKVCAKELFSRDMKDEYTKIVEEYLGRGRNVMDCTTAQIDQMSLILQDLKDFIENLKTNETEDKE